MKALELNEYRGGRAVGGGVLVLHVPHLEDKPGHRIDDITAFLFRIVIIFIDRVLNNLNIATTAGIAIVASIDIAMSL